MNAPFRWGFPIVAAIATLVALAANTDQTVAVPAAMVAVAAAGLALWDSVRDRTPRPGLAASVPAPLPVNSTEQWFRSGLVGQEAIVLLLDRIDRELVNSALPNREVVELTRLRSLPREEFLAYLESRLVELERGS